MLELESLTKKYPHRDVLGHQVWKTAVDHLSFCVEDGEIFGLLGPNGAGKTTTIRMLSLLSRPSSGKILYDGQNPELHWRKIRSQIGVVPQHINFDQDLTARENLELHARLYHMDKRLRKSRIDELFHFVDLEDVQNDSVRRLSGGMKRRLLIARALLERPRILFLDEPTVALDAQVRRRIWHLLEELSSSGVTIFITTHYIEEAEALCHRVAFLKHGKLQGVGRPADFKQQTGLSSLEEVYLSFTAAEKGSGWRGREH